MAVKMLAKLTECPSLRENNVNHRTNEHEPWNHLLQMIIPFFYFQR